MRQLGLSVFLAILLLGTPLSAQMGRSSVRFSATPGLGAGHHHFPRALNFGAAFFPDYLGPYDTSPSVIVVQAPASAPAEHPPLQTEEPKPAAPVMIEWQGDRYVRRTVESESNQRTTQPDYIASRSPQPINKNARTTVPTSTATSAASESAAADLPPATFIFRDGHREQSSDYSIISGVIYARGDYWSTGSWSRQIPLAQLDLPATFKANEDRGIAFRIPTAPYEVITRP